MQRLSGLLIIFLFCVGCAASGQPTVGQPAPDFRLQDQNGKWHSLTDYTGNWVVLYFYPKDDTPGCTTEACAFRDEIFKYRDLGVELLGVSVDDVESHAEFAEKYHLPFPLLADIEKTASEHYGVLAIKGLYSKRETFIIAPDGKVAAHYPEVNPENHAGEILADLADLMDGAS